MKKYEYINMLDSKDLEVLQDIASRNGMMVEQIIACLLKNYLDRLITDNEWECSLNTTLQEIAEKNNITKSQIIALLLDGYLDNIINDYKLECSFETANGSPWMPKE